jgi:Family of unknown function (DUF6011)
MLTYINTTPVLDDLRDRVMRETAEARTKSNRRPSWAPFVDFGEELVSKLIDAEFPPDKSDNDDDEEEENWWTFGRLWAQWAKYGKTYLKFTGWDLRHGFEHTGEIITRLHVAKEEGQWWVGPQWTRLIKPARVPNDERVTLRHRVRDLGLAQILSFAGDPEASMLSASRKSGRCSRCARVLTDHDSVLRGIGPECIKSVGPTQAQAAVLYGN